tara:strand:+ start:543 stop:776 length:234 start_codon:yes stop_codon:yes gene_type:complete
MALGDKTSISLQRPSSKILLEKTEYERVFTPIQLPLKNLAYVTNQLPITHCNENLEGLLITHIARHQERKIAPSSLS